MNYLKKDKNENSSAAYLIQFFIFEVVLVLVCLLFVFLFNRFDSFKNENYVNTAVFDRYHAVTVIIDAGHGGEDGGAVSDTGIVEKDLNLDIALKTRDFLEMLDVNVVLSRDKDVLLYESGQESHKKFHDISNRISLVQSYENAVLVSIHQNKFPIRKYSGFQVYYSKNNSGSSILAKSLQENVVNFLQPHNTRKIKQADKSIRLLDSVDVPAVLAECGFLSNSDEATLLNNIEYRNKIAYLISVSVVQYINECEEN